MSVWSESLDGFVSDIPSMSDSMKEVFSCLKDVRGWDFDGLARSLVDENMLPKTADTIALHDSGALLFIEFKPTKNKFEDPEDGEFNRMEIKSSLKNKAADSMCIYRGFLKERFEADGRKLWFILVSDNPRLAATLGSVPDPKKMGGIFLSRYAVRDKEDNVLFYDEVRIFTKEQFIAFAEEIVDPVEAS